jgi:hypothetical protein
MEVQAGMVGLRRTVSGSPADDMALISISSSQKLHDRHAAATVIIPGHECYGIAPAARRNVIAIMHEGFHNLKSSREIGCYRVNLQFYDGKVHPGLQARSPGPWQGGTWRSPSPPSGHGD